MKSKFCKWFNVVFLISLYSCSLSKESEDNVSTDLSESKKDRVLNNLNALDNTTDDIRIIVKLIDDFSIDSLSLKDVDFIESYSDFDFYSAKFVDDNGFSDDYIITYDTVLSIINNKVSLEKDSFYVIFVFKEDVFLCDQIFSDLDYKLIYESIKNGKPCTCSKANF